MRKILNWYRFHALRAFDFDRAWPWQKVYWTNMGDDDNEYDKEHGLSWPWRKAFWLRPHMKRWYSIIMLMLGVHAFFFALIFLAIAVDLLVWAIAG